MSITSKFLFPAALALAALNASAGVLPAFDKFGALSQATFGGTGISNQAVAIDAFAGKSFLSSKSNTITLGLTVTPDGNGAPAVANNGAGVFTVDLGVNKSASSFYQQLAEWNVDFYIGGANLGNLYTYELLIDVDPSSKDNFKTFYLSMNDQDSWNLGALALELVGGYSFNPNAPGQYDIELEAVQLNGTVAGKTSITVNAVPEPASLALVGVALAGAAFAARRRKA